MFISAWISSAVRSQVALKYGDSKFGKFYFFKPNYLIEPNSSPLALMLPSLMYYTRHVLQLTYEASESGQATALYCFTLQPQILGMSDVVISIFCGQFDQVRMLIANP
jgi:hypothetical protein